MLDALDPSSIALRVLTLVVLTGLGFALWRLAGALVARRRDAAAGQLAPAEIRGLLPADHAAILYFSGPRCAPCLRQRPVLKRLRETRADLAVVEVDVEQRPDLAQRLGILTVPSTAVVGADGRIRALNFGFAPAEQLSAQLRETR